MTEPPGRAADWPDRPRWLAAGFVPCRTQGCHILISPSLLPDGYCVSCGRRRRRNRR